MFSAGFLKPGSCHEFTWLCFEQFQLFTGSGNSDEFGDKALVITGVVPFLLLFLIDLVDFGPDLFLVFVFFYPSPERPQ